MPFGGDFCDCVLHIRVAASYCDVSNKDLFNFVRISWSHLGVTHLPLMRVPVALFFFLPNFSVPAGGSDKPGPADTARLWHDRVNFLAFSDPSKVRFLPNYWSAKNYYQPSGDICCANRELSHLVCVERLVGASLNIWLEPTLCSATNLVLLTFTTPVKCPTIGKYRLIG